MRTLAHFILALCTVLLPGGVQAVVLQAHTGQVNALASATYLEDTDGRWTLEDVRARDAEFKPWTGGGRALNFGLTASAYWVRLTLQRSPDAPSDWLLEVPYANLDQIDVYPPHAPAVRTGKQRPFDTRAYPAQLFVFPLQVSAEATHVYLRVASSNALTVPLTLWRPLAYQVQAQHFQMLQFAYYGGLAVLVLYGLTLAVALKQPVFLWFALYILFAGLGIFSGNGYGGQLLWPHWPGLDAVSEPLFFSLGAFFVSLFSRTILFANSSRRSRFDAALRLCQGLFLLVFAMTVLQFVLPALLRPAQYLLLLNTLALGLLVTTASFQAYRQQRPGVRFFFWGWTVLWVGVSVSTLRIFGWVPTNVWTSYAVQLSTALEMVMMAMALADRLILATRERYAAQRQALANAQQLLDLTQSSELRLKQAVRERTQQLQASLDLEKQLREQYVRLGSMISHEFRTLLGIIQSQASLMRKEIEVGLSQGTQRLETLMGAASRLSVMFDKWLQSDALGQTLDRLTLKPLVLASWLPEFLQTHGHLLVDHRLDCQIDAHATEVWADSDLLAMALGNLLDNASKYSPAETTITVRTLRQGGRIGLAVQDQGPGIAPDQGDVFAEFVRLNPHSRVRGVGLGLSIVRRIMHAHGGEVTLDTTPGRGTTFWLWLPEAPPAPEAQSSP